MEIVVQKIRKKLSKKSANIWSRFLKLDSLWADPDGGGLCELEVLEGKLLLLQDGRSNEDYQSYWNDLHIQVDQLNFTVFLVPHKKCTVQCTVLFTCTIDRRIFARYQKNTTMFNWSPCKLLIWPQGQKVVLIYCLFYIFSWKITSLCCVFFQNNTRLTPQTLGYYNQMSIL